MQFQRCPCVDCQRIYTEFMDRLNRSDAPALEADEQAERPTGEADTEQVQQALDVVAYKTGMDFDRKALGQLQATAERYHANLSDETAEYLAGRGILGSVVDQFRLGTCDDIHDGWLSIPYLRASGVMGFKFRRLDDGKPKYKNQGSTHLFNTADLDIADQTGEIAIAEGEIDAITASALCGVPCVGIPGATQWAGNPHWWELFRGYQRVWILADPDEAGYGLAVAIMDTLPSARLVKLPGDVNECYMADMDIKGFLR